MTTPVDLAPIGQMLEQAYGHIQHTRMRGLPIVNPVLRVEAVGLREWDGLCVGVIVTPWCMNLLALPLPGGRDIPPSQAGTTQVMQLPTGRYDLLAAHLPQIGHHLSGSLYSPMDAFTSQEQAVNAARDALALMFDVADTPKPNNPAAPAPAQSAPTATGTASRRGFLFGRVAR